MREAVALVVLAVLSGCGIVHERTAEVDGGPIVPMRDGGVVVRPDAFVPPNDAWRPPFEIAPHAPMPVITDQGGRRMRHPRLVAITFADDPDRDVLERHLAWLASSSWLTTVGADYGVTGATYVGAVHRPQAAPDHITGEEIATMLDTGIANGSLLVPPGDPLDELLFVLYFPPHTTVDDPQVGTSCVAFGGYHNEAITPDGRLYSYAVIPSCGSFNPLLTDVEAEQEAVAHEVIEGATDPAPFSAPGWAFGQTTAELSPWLLAGAEVADLCQYRTGSWSFVREAGFVACRVWSNTNARRNDRDACIPVDPPGLPFATVSILPADVQFASPGDTVRFDVVAWTTAPTSDLTVAAVGGEAGAFSFMPDVSIGRTFLNNGDHARLDVRIPFGAGSGQFGVVYVQVMDGAGNTDIVPAGVVVP